LAQIEPLSEFPNNREIRLSSRPAGLGTSMTSQTVMKFADLHAGHD
jgi:hypothetical protein